MNSHSPRSPRPAQDPARRRRLLLVLTVAMLASWLLLSAPLPFSLLSGVTGLVALIALIPMIIQAVRDRRWSLAVVGALFGIPATLMIVLGAVLSGLFYGPLSELEECRSTALTDQAHVQCDAEVQGSMAEWISGLTGG